MKHKINLALTIISLLLFTQLTGCCKKIFFPDSSNPADFQCLDEKTATKSK